MLSNDKSIETLEQLFVEIREYLKLQKQYTKLELTDKLTKLFSTMLLVLLVLILGMVALFYLSFTIAYLMGPAVGGLMGSFAIITAFNLLLIALIVIFRRKLIVLPIVKFLAELFLEDEDEETTTKDEE
jgi:hypothetical protein